MIFLKHMTVDELLRCFVFKQKTTYEMRISDWSSDGCSSERYGERCGAAGQRSVARAQPWNGGARLSTGALGPVHAAGRPPPRADARGVRGGATASERAVDPA